MRRVVVRFREVDRDKFEALSQGQKTIETRAATPKYHHLQAGDVLVALCGSDRAEKRITQVNFYKTAAALIDDLGYAHILPTARTRQEAIDIYDSFPGYQEKVKEFGMVALFLSTERVT